MWTVVRCFRVFVALLPAVLFLAQATVVAAMETALDGLRPGDESFVAAVRFNGRGLPEYYDLIESADGTLLLPVAAIFLAGEASVERDDGRLQLEVASSGVRLVIDRYDRIVHLSDRQRPLGADDIRYHDETYLVSSALLAEAFQLTSRFNKATQELTVTSARPFPRDLRLARERRWDRLDPKAPLAAPVRSWKPDYVLFGSPQVDVSLSGHQNDTGQATGSWSALAVGEALFLTHHLYAAGSQDDPLSSLRLRSGRMSPTGGVFGLDRLYDAQFGDISGLRLPLVGGGNSGRGLRLQATPLRRADNFDRTLIEGDAPAGWDAELYLGATLLDFQRIGQDGRYRFDDVPLDYGVNDLKVVLYGPQGQVRETLFRKQIGSGMVPPGEIQGSAFLLEDGVKLFEGANETAFNEGGGSWIAGVKTDIGLHRRLTAGLFGARAPTGRSTESDAGQSGAVREVDDYFGLELRPALGRLVLETGVAGCGLGGAAAYGRFSLPVASTSISGGYYHYDPSYASQDNDGGQLASRTHLRFGIPLGTDQAGRGSVSVSLEEERHRDSQNEREASLTYGHRLGPLSLTHKLESRWLGDGFGGPSGLYTLNASYRHDLFDLRGELSHGLGHGSEEPSLTLSGLWRRNDFNRIYCTLSLSPGGQTTYGVGWNQDLKWAVLSVSASAGNGEYNFGMGLNFSFGHTPAGGLLMSSQARSTTGFADLQIFEDLDADGVFTEGRDRPILGAGVMVNRRPFTEASTDDQGRIGLDGLSIYDPLELAVNTYSLPDPFLVPIFPASKTWPRPGRTVEIALPVTESCEISGTLKMRVKKPVTNGRNGKNGHEIDGLSNGAGRPAERIVERPLAGIRIQVLDADGRLHGESLTFSDGYFVFDAVYPGRWTVRVPAGQNVYGTVLQGVANTADAARMAVVLSDHDRYVTDLELVFEPDGRLAAETVHDEGRP